MDFELNIYRNEYKRLNIATKAIPNDIIMIMYDYGIMRNYIDAFEKYLNELEKLKNQNCTEVTSAYCPE